MLFRIRQKIGRTRNEVRYIDLSILDIDTDLRVVTDPDLTGRVGNEDACRALLDAFQEQDNLAQQISLDRNDAE